MHACMHACRHACSVTSDVWSLVPLGDRTSLLSVNQLRIPTTVQGVCAPSRTSFMCESSATMCVSFAGRSLCQTLALRHIGNHSQPLLPLTLWLTCHTAGRRPSVTKAWNFIDHFRLEGPDWISMPQHFKEHGFFTQGAGKTFHPHLPPDFDGAQSWSEAMAYQNITSQECNQTLKLSEAGEETEQLSTLHVCPEDKPDHEFLDHMVGHYSDVGQ